MVLRFFTDGEEVKMVNLPTTNAESAWGLTVPTDARFGYLPRHFLEWMIVVSDFFCISRRKWHGVNNAL
jgi:hypothetical protein